ncbi:HTH_Tnp_Tc3_2 domain-containing protein [Trichonephila clavipes]|nr:HTH_Tnp_Tc3_2 domain-containing protein [Trichonephila clavipes]
MVQLSEVRLWDYKSENLENEIEQEVIMEKSSTEGTGSRGAILRDMRMMIFEFERGRIIERKEAGWENRRIARHMGRSDAATRRCWQEWVGNGRFQRHDGSDRLRATTDWEGRLIVRSAATVSDLSLSIMRRATHIRVSNLTIQRRLIE